MVIASTAATTAALSRQLIYSVCHPFESDSSKMEKWFCQIRGQMVGPITPDQLGGLAANGEIDDETLVRKESADEWVALATVRELLVGGVPDSPDEALSGDAAEPPAGLEASTSESVAWGQSSKSASRCSECGRSLVAGQATCAYCGHSEQSPSQASLFDPIQSDAPPTYMGLPEESVETLGEFYRGPFRKTKAVLAELDLFHTGQRLGYIAGAYALVGLMLLIVDLFAASSMFAYYFQFSVGALVCVLAVVLQFVVEGLLVGVAIKYLGVPFPSPERSMRAIGEVVVSKVMVILLVVLLSIFIPFFEYSPDQARLIVICLFLGVPALFFVSLPSSIYAQRFNLRLTTAIVVSLVSLSVNLLALIGFVFLADPLG